MKSRLIALLAAMTLAASSLVLWSNPVEAQSRYTLFCLMASGLSENAAVAVARQGGYSQRVFAIQSGRQAALAVAMRCLGWPDADEWEELMDLARAIDQRRMLKILKWEKKRWEEWKKEQEEKKETK